MPEQPPMTIVVASNSHFFRVWCRDNGRRPTDPDVEYVDLANAPKIENWTLRNGIDVIVDLGGDPDLIRRLQERYS